MHVVVNHLHLRERLADDTMHATREVVQEVVAAGALAACVLEVDETHLILVLEFASAEDAERVSREIGGPWVREHIRPFLERDTERSVGKVIASAQAGL